MSQSITVNLADCSQFRQTVAARPPRIVHGAVILMLSLLAAALTWAGLAKANLVVRSPGRVRPVEVPERIFAPAGADMAGRVVEAPFDEGDVVKKGEVLIRLDTAQIDNRIAKLQRTFTAAEEELAKLKGLEALIDEQLDTAKAKAAAELKQAKAAAIRAFQQRASSIRAADAGVVSAKDVLKRKEQLRASRAVTEEEIVKAATALREAEEKLIAAKLPVDHGPVDIAQQALDLVEREFAVRRAEAEARRAVKEGEVAAASRDLRQLELQKAEAILRSPIDGVVVVGQIDVGDVLEPGKPVMEIAPQDGYRFEGVLLSEDVGHVRVGMPVRIKFDAYDYQKYGVMTGKVTYLSPDSQLPRDDNGQTSAEQPTRVSRKSPASFLVRIEMDADAVGRGELTGPVKLGLGGAAEIVTDRESLLMIFFRKIRQTISLG